MSDSATPVILDRHCVTAAREALELNRTEFCSLIDFTLRHLYNLETGQRPLSRQTYFALSHLTMCAGVASDWRDLMVAFRESAE